MKASRLLPSAAFAVAVGFFFVPPVLSLAGFMPPVSRPQTRLEIRSEKQATLPALKPSLSSTASKAQACAPAALPSTEALPVRKRSVVAMADPVR